MINLENNYGIVVDSMSYNLVKLGKKDKKGKDTYSTVGYFKDLRTALRAYRVELVRKELEASTTLTDAVKAIQKADLFFEEMLKRIPE